MNLISKIVLAVIVCLSIVAPLIAQENKITTFTAKVPLTSNLSGINNSDQVNVDVQYFDALGRPVQSVMKQASPSDYGKKDIVFFQNYDEYGRQYIEYLPYMRESVDGSFDPNALANQQVFYSSFRNATDASYAFSEAVLEASPQSRPVSQSSPGYSWRKNGGHTYDMIYSVNTGTSEVRMLLASGSQIGPATAEYYYPGELSKHITKDENVNSTITYTNRLGQVVLKQVQLDASSYASTYYVYDDFENLRYVIQPEGVNALTSDYSQINDDNFRQKWMFCYEYDGRKRMISKRVPGSDWVYMIYDNRDRLVMTQSGNERNIQTISESSSVDLYQGKDYHVTAGTLTLSPGFSFTSSATRSFTASAMTKPQEKWLVTKYDALNRPVITGVYYSSSTISTLRSQAQTSSTLLYTGTGALEGYADNGFPELSQKDLLTVTYYDNYNHTNDSHWSLGNYTTELAKKGMVTGSKTRVLGDNTLLESVNLYDNRNRADQTISENHLSGQDNVAIEYSNLVSGNIKKITRNHTSSGINKNFISEYTYDHRDRVKTIKETHDNIISITTNTHNQLGELTSKNINGAQTVDYSYNIRGWLTKMNDHTNLGASDKFGMELQYDAAGQYNGNIGKMLWKSAQGSGLASAVQSYTYTYDKASRLTSASYNAGLTGAGYYNVSGITYDANGNILTLVRKFNNISADNLDYDYSGNQLNTVGDSYDNSLFDEARSEGKVANEYLYDANGNMTRDLNKGISNITYNYLNLPEAITTKEGTIYYTYDATGAKLRKFYDKQTSADETTDYVDGLQYENGIIDFIKTTEGRYRFSVSAYEYNLTDHLGNVRVSVNAAGEVIQRDDYYPFGLTFNSFVISSPNYYLFNGNEFEEEIGWFDFNTRLYDATLGRFNSIDLFSDFSPEWTPYRFAFDNPIAYTDPTGLYEGQSGYWTKNDDGFLDVLSYFGITGSSNKDGENSELDENSISKSENLSTKEKEMIDPFPSYFKQLFTNLFKKIGIYERESDPHIKIKVNGIQYVILGDSKIGSIIEEFGGKFDPKKNTYTMSISEMKDLLDALGFKGVGDLKSSGDWINALKWLASKSGDATEFSKTLKDNFDPRVVYDSVDPGSAYEFKVNEDSSIIFYRGNYKYKGKSGKGSLSKEVGEEKVKKLLKFINK